MKLTLADFIAMNVRSFPDQQALEVLGAAPESYTYRDMWLRVSALAGALREVEPGPHGPVAATLLPNGTDALLIYLAGQLAGCAIVPVNTRLAHPEILHIVNDSGARAHLLQRGPAGHGGRHRRRGADTGATVVDPTQLPTPGGGLRDPAVPDPAKGDRLAAVFYTSGTTGAPKGAAMTNDTWLVNAMRWGWQLGLSWDSVMLVPGPLFHMSYCSFAFGTLMIGRAGPDHDVVRGRPGLRQGFTGTATTAFLVPSMTSMMIEEWERRGRPPLASMRAMMTAAASVSPEALGEAYAMFPERPDRRNLRLDRGRVRHRRDQAPRDRRGRHRRVLHPRLRDRDPGPGRPAGPARGAGRGGGEDRGSLLRLPEPARRHRGRLAGDFLPLGRHRRAGEEQAGSASSTARTA